MPVEAPASGSMSEGDNPCPSTDDSFVDPQSKAIDEKLAYRFLSENDKSILRGRLTNDYKYIIREYSKLNRGIRKSLRDRSITPKQLAEVLLELDAFPLHRRDKRKPLLAECLDDIENAKDIADVFKILRPYRSFFDCHVIECIVDSELCTDEDKQNLSKYLEKLDEYCQRSIHECPHFATPDDDPMLKRLVVKVDDDISKSFTIKAFDAFRVELATKFNLKPHTLHLCSVEEGCLQLTFQIPTFVKNEIFPLSEEQKHQLERLHVQKIDCDGVQFIASVPVFRMVSLSS